MAKKRTKAQKEAKPVFDDAALTKLTAKIDTALSKPQTKEHKQKDERPGKRKRSDNETKDATPKKRQAQEATNGVGKHQKAQKPQKPQKSQKGRNLDLLEEIKALGGDEDDLDLVAGIDSDAEEGQGPKPSKASEDLDKSLKNELAKFAAGLGFDQVRDEVVATDDEAEEVVEEVEEVEAEHWEDEPEEEEEAEEEEEEEAQPANEPQKRSAAGKLVSMRHLGRACLSGV